MNAGSKCKLLPWAVQVESSDLIAYGLIPEFIGRFPVLVSLAALNEDQLVQVLVRFTSVKPFFAFLTLFRMCKCIVNLLTHCTWERCTWERFTLSHQ